MNADRLKGVLKVERQGPYRPLLVQLTFNGTQFNLSRKQLLDGLNDLIEANPEALNGRQVEFEMQGGQPTAIGSEPPSNNSRSIYSEANYSEPTEVGYVERYRFDSGVIRTTDETEIRFYQDGIGKQGWDPSEGDAVTFVLSSKRPDVADHVAPLSACTDMQIVRECIASNLPIYWRPVIRQFLKSLEPAAQLDFIAHQQGELERCERWEWWGELHEDVRVSPKVLGLLPQNVAAQSLALALTRIAKLEPIHQATWLRERSPFLELIPRKHLLAFSPQALWEQACWNLLNPTEKAQIFTTLVRRLPLEKLLARLDPTFSSLLGSEIESLIIEVIRQSATDGNLYPTAWHLIANTLEQGSVKVPENLREAPALLGSLCCFPEISGVLPESTNQGANKLGASFRAAVRAATFAKFAPRPHLGCTPFSALDPEDLLLAAVYASIDPKFSERCTELLGSLNCRGDWTWENLSSRAKSRDDQAWAEFLVKGVQPRVAELAFGKIHSELELGFNPVDLNRAVLSNWSDWSLKSAKELFQRNAVQLAEDWADDSQRRYDVKCNLFFRSRGDVFGLRGFCVNVERESKDRDVFIAGFVFHASTELDCSWLFVGLLHPASMHDDEKLEMAPPHRQKTKHQRIAPFFFLVPKSHRLADNPEPEGAQALSEFLAKTRGNPAVRSLDRLMPPIMPLLNCSGHYDYTHLLRPEELLLNAIQAARTRLAGSRWVRIERVLWDAVTNLVFDYRNSGETEAAVNEILNIASGLVKNRWFPVVLPSIERGPLLLEWVDRVLQPLNSHWREIRCPACNRVGANRKIKPRKCTAELTLRGDFSCDCGFSAADVTLLTHCHECHRHPLIIGQNAVCWSCQGLRCHGSDDQRCDACKPTCTRVPDRARPTVEVD